jgi:hypothetical protein
LPPAPFVYFVFFVVEKRKEGTRDEIGESTRTAGLCATAQALYQFPVVGLRKPLAPARQLLRLRPARSQQRVRGALHPGTRRRPGPLLRAGNRAGPHRVALHISDDSRQVRFVQGRREEPVCPQVAQPAVAGVQPRRETPVRQADATRKRVLALRHYDEMHVVRHQTPRPEPPPAQAEPWRIPFHGMIRKANDYL